MTIYSGETIRLQTIATDFDGSILTDTEVERATVTVYRKSDSVLIFMNDLTYDPIAEHWYFDWQTGGATPASAGSYIMKMEFMGFNYITREYKDFRLRANRV